MLNKQIKVIGSAILFIISVILPIGIDQLLKVPSEQWLNMTWYYVVVGVVCYLGLILIWALPVRGEKNRENKLIEKVDKLINEVRQERNERNNRDKK